MVVELIYRKDRASVSGAEGCRFDSCAGYQSVITQIYNKQP